MEDTTVADGVNAPGNLDKFHLGISTDGANCLLLFVDEEQHVISCMADFAEFNAFISALAQAAAEMSRRRNAALEEDGGPGAGQNADALDIASAAFTLSPQDGCLLGSLIGANGKIVGIRMRPEVANEMTRSMLLTTPAASAC